MPSRQDQLHSYQFMVQRVVAALVMRETDPARSPFRRAAGAALASVLVAVIALAGVAVYGLIVGGGSTNWRDSDTVVVEKETGAVFVYREEKLYPVLNFSSALLIVGSSAPKKVLVSRKSIAGVARGAPLGISSAPDSLPDAKSLFSGAWTLCSGRRDGTDSPQSMLAIGTAGGDRAGAGGESLGDKAVLVRGDRNSVYLVWRNHRYRVFDQARVLAAFGWSSQPLVPLAPALLNAIPAGSDLKGLDIGGRGRNSWAVPGTRIGQVLVWDTVGGRKQYAVVKREGLAEITQVQAALILGDQRTAEKLGDDPEVRFDLGRYAKARKAGSLVPKSGDDAPPATIPELVAPQGGTVCAVISDDSGVTDVRVGGDLPDAADAMRTGGRTSGGRILADLVAVEPGRGAVVEATPAPGNRGGALSVVTDLGIQYAVPKAEVLDMLGYAGVRPVRMPASLVSLLPSGSALDPKAARTPVVRG